MNETKPHALELATAREMGRKAHAAGIGAAPILDNQIMQFAARFQTTSDKHSHLIVSLFSAWLDGWHSAHLAELDANL